MATAQIRLHVTPSTALRRQMTEHFVDMERRAKHEMVQSRDRLQQATEDLCPERSRYMRTHVRAEPTSDGLGYTVGWHASDFIGNRNRFGELITDFYPVFPEFGTRFMAPRPSLTPAAIAEFGRLPARLAAAMDGRTF